MIVAELAYIANDNQIEIDELRDADDAYQNSATVTLIAVNDSEGAPVAGLTLPISLAYVTGSDGRYRCTLQDSAELEDGAAYVAIVTIDAGGLQARFEIPFTARTRTTR